MRRENWMVLERLLQDAGFQVRVAEDGAQGVETFRAVAAAFHLDGSADAGDGWHRGDAAHPGTGGRARGEDCGDHRFGIRR